MERELRSGQSHEYRLELDAGRYARLRLSQPGVDVNAALHDPLGRTVAGTAGPSGTGEDETVSLVTVRSGRYRLVITPRDPRALPGRYRLVLQELRPATVADGRRVAAERAVEEGRQASRIPATRPLAIEKHREALDLWRVIGDLRGEAIAWKDLGVALADDGKYEEGLAMYWRSFEIWRRLGDRSQQNIQLQNIGQLHLYRGHSDEARAAFQRSLPLATSRAQQANSLGGIGASYFQRNELDKALEILSRARSLIRGTGDVDNEATMLGLIAAIRQTRGEIEEASRAVDEGLRLAQNLEVQAYLRYLRGNLLLDLGDLERAAGEYGRALALYTRLGDRPWQDRCRAGIGRVRLYRGDPQGALELAEQIGEEDFAYEQALAYWALGRPDRAAALLEKALELQPKDSREEGESRLALGIAYRDLGRLREAAASLGRAEELGRRWKYPGLVSPALYGRAQVARDQGQLERARSFAEEALRLIEKQRSRVAERDLRTSFFASRRAYYELHAGLMARLDLLNPGRGHREEAFAASERARARVLLDLLDEARIARDARRRDPGAASAGLSTGSASPAPAPLGLDEIRALLDEETALLEYLLGKERSFLFVVTRQRLEVFELPPAPEIEEKVKRLRRLLVKPTGRRGGSRAYALAAHGLYEDVVAPAAGALAGKRRLIIAPDRSLYLVPFEALLTRPAAGLPFTEMPFLIQEYAVSNVPSASVLARLRAPLPRLAAARRRFIGFADPRLEEGRASPDLKELPDARREVREIAGLFGLDEAKLYLGAEATEDTVKGDTEVATAASLHFAVHGLLDEKHPERSELVLARGPGGREDGSLQAFEVFDLKLAADLVVLSACQSAGEEVTGEGLVGFTRAFLYAGASSVAVSLWPVSDPSTATLMVRFYRGLGRSGDKAEALRDSKRAMIADHRLAHPFHWSSFVLVGDPGRKL